MWTEDKETRARLGYHEDGYRWSSMARCRRYVDDLMVHFDVSPQSAELNWPDMRVVLEPGEIWAKEKTYRSSPPFASDFRLL